MCGEKLVWFIFVMFGYFECVFIIIRNIDFGNGFVKLILIFYKGLIGNF